jgi:predicted AAA+ superfamily ATPase
MRKIIEKNRKIVHKVKKRKTKKKKNNFILSYSFPLSDLKVSL